MAARILGDAVKGEARDSGKVLAGLTLTNVNDFRAIVIDGAHQD